MGLTRDAANVLKWQSQTTTRVRTLKQMRTVPLICDNQVINCQAAAWSSLLVDVLC